MSLDLHVKISAWYTDDYGKIREIGDGPLDNDRVVAYASEVVYDRTFSVAASTTQELWDAADGPSDFDYIIVLSTQDGYLQTLVDDNGTYGELYFQQKILADIPQPIPSKVALAGNGVVDTFTGTADTIDRVNFKNLSSTTTAQVRILAVT